MEKIRLLYVTSELSSVHEHRFISLLSNDENIDLSVAHLNYKGFYYPGVEDLKFRKFEMTANVKWLKNKYLRAPIDVWYQIAFYFFLKKVIRENKFDVIHSSDLLANSYLAVKTGFHPILAMSWGSDVLNNPYARYNPHRNAYLRMRLRTTARLADAVYSDANSVADTLVALTGISKSKIHVFPQIGIDTERFKPDRASGEKVRKKYNADGRRILLMTRSLKSVYGVGDFIHALPEVVAKHPDVLALVAGEGDLRDSLLNDVERLGLSNNVVFIGNIVNSELQDYLNAADVYVSTSHSDGTSLSMLEALSSGLPLVVTDVPAVMEWIEEGRNGAVARIGDSKSISGALLRILECPADKLRQICELNRRVAVEKAEIMVNYKKLVSIYRDLVSESRKTV